MIICTSFFAQPQSSLARDQLENVYCSSSLYIINTRKSRKGVEITHSINGHIPHKINNNGES